MFSTAARVSQMRRGDHLEELFAPEAARRDPIVEVTRIRSSIISRRESSLHSAIEFDRWIARADSRSRALSSIAFARSFFSVLIVKTAVPSVLIVRHRADNETRRSRAVSRSRRARLNHQFHDRATIYYLLI
ncbi:hypothetical protein QLX08_004876 [Tetragonisca angustula]|uniref:Uncharacterized protein n=1 Tax=Tetragonisca angustula TaxID=166442 RepID=A0AAW1A3C9_9HYME